MKRTISVLLAVLMLLSILAACSGSGTPQDTTPISEPPSEPTAESSAPGEQTPQAPPADTSPPDMQPEQPDEPEEPVDSGLSMVAYDLPLFEETFEVSMLYPIRTGGSNPAYKAEGRNIFWNTVQEMLNIKITFIEPGQVTAGEQYNLMAASGDLPDIISESMVSRAGSAYTGGYDLAIAEDVYVNIADYLDIAPNYNYWLNVNPSNMKAAMTANGNIGSFVTINAEPRDSGMGTVVNKDYLDATGLDIPDTVDGWLEVFAAMKANGVEFPCNTTAEGGMLGSVISNALGASFSSTFLIDAATDELLFDAIQPEVKEYIELFRDCYQKGYIDPDFTSIFFLDSSKFNEGVYATWDGMAQEIENYITNYGFNACAAPIVRADGLGAHQPLLGAEEEQLVSDLPGMAITTNCKDIESAVKFLDWLYSEEGYMLANYGIEGKTYEIVDGKPKILPFYQERDEATSSGNKSLYTGDGDFGLVLPNLNRDLASDIQLDAYENWTSDTSAARLYTLPGAVMLTAEESESVSSLATDISTYVESQILKWFICEDDFNDAAWDNYVAQIEGMNLQILKETYTAAYHRYLGE